MSELKNLFTNFINSENLIGNIHHLKDYSQLFSLKDTYDMFNLALKKCIDTYLFLDYRIHKKNFDKIFHCMLHLLLDFSPFFLDKNLNFEFCEICNKYLQEIKQIDKISSNTFKNYLIWLSDVILLAKASIKNMVVSSSIIATFEEAINMINSQFFENQYPSEKIENHQLLNIINDEINSILSHPQNPFTKSKMIKTESNLSSKIEELLNILIIDSKNISKINSSHTSQNDIACNDERGISSIDNLDNNNNNNNDKSLNFCFDKFKFLNIIRID